MGNININFLETAAGCLFVKQVAEQQLEAESKESYQRLRSILTESQGRHMEAILRQLEEENRKAEEIKELLDELQQFIMRASLSLSALDRAYSVKHVEGEGMR